MQNKKSVVCLIGLLAALNCGFPVFAQSVTRGAYLQQGTPESAIVRWRTDIATDSVVRFGDAPGNLTSESTVPGTRTEHEVNVSGLNADTRYYYSVGNSQGPLQGDNADYFFSTSPVLGTEKPTRVWVIGDSGTANSNARAVRDAYITFNGTQTTDLWLMLGDNAYQDGTDAQYQVAVFDTYPELLRKIMLWPTLGNHDGHTANSATQSGPYYDIFTLPTNAESGGLSSGTEAYYSFDYGNIHFISMDSYETDRSPGGAMMTWLENDLIANDKEWVIAFWHHPPYSKGSHNSDSESRLIDMRENALPLLESYGVDLVLTGHSHAYERSFLLDGHYDISSTLQSSMILNQGDGRENGDGAYFKSAGGLANDGAVYIVAGSSGRISGGPLNHPAMFVSINSLGSMVLDINGDALDAVFLNSSGVVADSFTISKGADNVPPNVVSVSADSADNLRVLYSEAVEQGSAESVGNYGIDQGITVNSATLAADGRTVILNTSALNSGIAYTLTVNNVADIGGNIIAPNSQAQFEFVTLITQEFQDGLAPDGNYTGTSDTFISQNAPTANFGGNGDLQVDGDDPGGSGSDLATLIRWDVSAIPADATVQSASMTLSVFNRSNGQYQFYELLRDWNELQAHWNQAANGNSWEVPGAQGTSDRGSSVLTSISAPTAGVYTLSINAEGIAAIQSWVEGSSDNNGFVLANSATTDGLDLDSSEAPSATDRPKLSVTYSIPGGSADTVPPSVPENLRATGLTGNTISLAWDASTDNVGVTGYRVFRNGLSIATPASTVFTDSALQPDTAYVYSVSVFDAAGNESVESSPLLATTAASVSFQDGVFPDSGYDGTRDGSLVEATPNTNFGSAIELLADGDDPPGSSNDLAALLYWDISTLGPGSLIDSVSITINVTNRSGGSYDLYEVLADWNEGEASWSEASNGITWASAGAQGSADRGSELLGTVTASSVGTYGLDLNPSGIAVVQDWVSGARANRGFILANSTTTDGLDFDSRETGAATLRPKLTIDYVPSNNIPPSANFSVTPNSGGVPLPISLDASSSSDSDGSIIGYDWDFGDGNSGTGLTSSHTFTVSGTYTITLTVTDNEGATDTSASSVVVNQASGLIVETGKLSAVTDVWQPVTLNNVYNSMVVVASVHLPSQAALPAVARIRNAFGNGFELRLQNPSGSPISGYDVHYMVVEEGVYSLSEHGISMEAVKVASIQTAENNNWVREVRSYQNSYQNPVVLGQVMTANDPDWSIFWASSATSRSNPPDSTSFAAGKNVGEDGDNTRADETLGIIVIEQGTGLIGTSEYVAALGSDSVLGVQNNGSGTIYPLSGLTSPSVAIVSAAAIDGNNGGWPVLFGANPLTASQLVLAFDEDQVNDVERNHTTEQVAYIVFSQ